VLIGGGVRRAHGRRCFQQVNHVLFYAQHDRADVRWVCWARERRFEVPEHAVHFAPADGEEHVRIAQVSRVHHFYMMLIPPRHLDEIVSSEGCRPAEQLRVMLGSYDPVLKMCISRLASVGCPGESCSPLVTSEASRRLVLRLAECKGSGSPDWSSDASVFDRRIMSNLVDYIDEHLRIAPSLSEMAVRVGLSPSHCAEKFRQSIGASVHRFINRRRVNKSLDILRATSGTLTGVALDLGFSSQSHFTRLFSDLTGMTPAKYRKQFRRTVG
jgi:AraC-like DNA-binding protein